MIERSAEPPQPVAEAAARVLAHAAPRPAGLVPLEDALRRVLREDVTADRDLPPFDRATMDGAAIAWTAWQQGRRRFTVEAVQAAGAPARRLSRPDRAVRIMTGAIVPDGAGCVIPRERLRFDGDAVEVLPDYQPVEGQHIHRQGVDARRGDVVLRAGTRLDAADLLIAAAVGRATLSVAQPPAFAVVSTGDEIVPVDAALQTHQIRDANAWGLQAALRRDGALQAERFHFPDDREILARGVEELLGRFDALIFTGGVSAGDFDFLPETLDRLGVKRLFHQVAQRPGKPFWFGVAPPRVVFALPGNPVSTLVCYHRYVRPWLDASLGAAPRPVTAAILDQAVEFAPPLTCFLQVRERTDEQGVRRVTPVAHHGSGDYASLRDTDGFVELAAGQSRFPAGQTVRYYPWS
jgi:molybdopterin molybdotransferase